MKKYVRLVLAYFPIILVCVQIVVNFMGAFGSVYYEKFGMYLNTICGSNLLTAAFFILYTFHFKFCKVSRSAAIAEGAFAIAYMLIGEDNIYNITFQIIIGMFAIAVSVLVYMKIFPECNISMAKDFFKKFVKKGGDCKSAIDEWEADRHTQINAKLKAHEQYTKHYS